MTCVFGEQVDGDFRLIVINWSLMIINFVMDTGGHSQQKILRSDVQGKVNCLSGFVSFLFIVHFSFFSVSFKTGPYLPLYSSLLNALCILQIGFYTPRIVVSVSFHAFYSDVPGSNLDTRDRLSREACRSLQSPSSQVPG